MRKGMGDMIQELIQNHIFMSSICLTGAASIILQWFIALSLKGYVRASSNMKTTKKKAMISLKNQFEAIYEMNSRVHNMDAYVDKYLLKLRFMGITYTGWEILPYLTGGVVTILAVAGGFYGYKNNSDNPFYAEILFSYVITLACLFVFFHIFGIKTRKQQIHIQLVDYLDNYLANRLLKGKNDKWQRDFDSDDNSEYYGEHDDEASPEYDEDVPQHQTMDEDMDMLKRLIREMDAKKSTASVNNEVAASAEEMKEGGYGSDYSEQSDAELLEEFVQSFLS